VVFWDAEIKRICVRTVQIFCISIWALGSDHMKNAPTFWN
jgi:hypothetical protein